MLIFLIALQGPVWVLSIGNISFSLLLEKRLREVERASPPELAAGRKLHDITDEVIESVCVEGQSQREPAQAQVLSSKSN